MTKSPGPVPAVRLNDSHRIPQLGFGVWQVPPDDAQAAVEEALAVGYRHIDTAAAYRNEAGVGAAVKASGLKREDVFITTKLWNADHGYDAAQRALAASLERLGTDYVDLYLIHWPVPSAALYTESWKALVELREQGLARSIGVSNFQPAHLEAIIAETGVTPALNQVELHPYLDQAPLRAEHERLGIVTEAWSPLASGEIFDNAILAEIADAHHRTVGQVVLRWHLQLNNVVIPKSVTPARIAENFRIFDFELDQHDIERMGALERGYRTGPNPDTFSLAAAQ